MLGAITEADFEALKLPKPVDRAGAPLPWSRVANGRLVQINDGRYAVHLGGADDDGVGAARGSLVRSSADRNREFVLDLRALRPLLAKRRPDLVLPGN